MIFGRRNLIIGQSKTKNCEESAGGVGMDVASQEPSKNTKQRKQMQHLFFHVEKRNVGNRLKRFCKFCCKRT